MEAVWPDDQAAYRAIAEAGAKLREGERKDLAVRIAEGTRKVIDGK
jgi:hypothetical protein